MSSILAKLMRSRRWMALRQHPPGGSSPHRPCWLHHTWWRTCMRWVSIVPVIWWRKAYSRLGLRIGGCSHITLLTHYGNIIPRNSSIKEPWSTPTCRRASETPSSAPSAGCSRDPAPAAAAAPAPFLRRVSPQAVLFRGVTAGLGTATSNTLPAARPRSPGSDQRPRSRRRKRTDADRAGAGPAAGPATQRRPPIGRPSSRFSLFSLSCPCCLFVSVQQVKDFNAVAKSEQHFHYGAPQEGGSSY